MDVQAEASTTNALSSGAEASAVEQPVVTAETSGRRRTRRAEASTTQTPTILAERRNSRPTSHTSIPNDEMMIEDANIPLKVEKPGFTTNVDAKSMAL